MNERLQKVVDTPGSLPTLVGALAFAGGAGLGYILGRRRKEYIYVQTLPAQGELDFTIEVSNEPPDQPYEEVTAAPRVLEDATILGPIVIDPSALTLVDDQPVPETVRRSIFAHTDGEWNYEEELKNRSDQVPYVLHKDEFFLEEEDSYAQISLSYFAGDDIMTDEDNTPVYNYSQIVGDLKFGHGSGDPNVFYVRNDKRKAEYEIVRNEGSYSLEVLGIEIEENARTQDLKHSAHRRFRDD